MKKTKLTVLESTKTKKAKPLPKPPELPAGMLGLYREICAHLAESDRFHPSDERIVRLYCLALVEAEKARVIVEKEGMLVEAAQGVKAHPLIATCNQARLTASKLATSLGLGPTARTRISQRVDPDTAGVSQASGWQAAAGKKSSSK